MMSNFVSSDTLFQFFEFWRTELNSTLLDFGTKRLKMTKDPEKSNIMREITW